MWNVKTDSRKCLARFLKLNEIMEKSGMVVIDIISLMSFDF